MVLHLNESDTYAIFSDMTTKGGGYVSVEDAQGSTIKTFLEEGFLDSLKKVLPLMDIFLIFYFLFSGMLVTWETILFLMAFQKLHVKF